MIEKLAVRSFKSLAQTEVDLGLVNVFVGANGSGKSNLLEALGVLGAAASGRVDDEALLRRGVRPGLPALYKSSFRGRPQPKHIAFGARDSGASYNVSLWNPIDRPRPAWEFKTELLKEAGRRVGGRSPASAEKLDKYSGKAALQRVELDSARPAAALLDALQGYVIYSPDTGTLRGLVPDAQAREPLGLRGGRLAEACEEVLFGRQAADDSHLETALGLIGWADAIGIGLPGTVPMAPAVPRPRRVLRFSDRYMLMNRRALSAYDASEGVLYVLFTLVLAQHPQSPPVFAVDNFDHALNPRLARAVARQFCEWMLERNDRQALLTSHNPLVLDGLPLRDDRVRLFAVDRTITGATQIRRVMVSEKVLAASERGTPISQQWVMGHFGGVPSDV